MPQIFPKSILENSVYYHRRIFQVHSLFIYNLVVWFVIAVLVALPLIKIDTFQTFQATITINSASNKIVLEGYASPTAVEFLGKESKLTFSVIGLDDRQWGKTEATLLKISSNIELIDGKPMLKVTYASSNDFIENTKGQRLTFKNGMKFSAKCQAKKKSLFELLFMK